jgi:hypothetical protein
LENATTNSELRVRIVKSTNLLYQPLGEEAVVLNLENEQYYGLDKTGVWLWQILDEYTELDRIIAQALAKYEVEEEVLRRDLAVFVDELQLVGLVTVKPLANN